MIARFLASWALFSQAYMTAWLIALLLSLIGVLVVARDQIFLGAAISQAATLGIAVALVLNDLLPGEHFAWLRSDSTLALTAVCFAVLAGLLTARRGQTGGESHEALTGWVFLGSASLAILIVAHSPHGLAEVQRLLSSSLIGATHTDVWVFGLCAVGSVVALGAWHRRILLLVGLSLRVSGMLYTFGCLVLPALIAKQCCREVRPLFLIAPLVALSLGALGCVLADATDSPPAQMTVALLSLALMIAWLLRWRRSHARAA